MPGPTSGPDDPPNLQELHGLRSSAEGRLGGEEEPRSEDLPAEPLVGFLGQTHGKTKENHLKKEGKT